jgi:hypothetical protein
MHINAESIDITGDEQGFVLEVFGYGGPDGDSISLDINIHGINLDAFYDQVKARIGSYLRERDEARQEHAQVLYDATAAYDLSDPKHPEFHSVHADIWDARDGK